MDLSTGTAVIKRLKALGLTQVDIARCLKIGTSTVSQWLKGTRAFPTLVSDDLYELLRLVEERTQAGANVHQAIDGWEPTLRFHDGGFSIAPGDGPNIPLHIAERALREGPQAYQRFLMAETFAALAKVVESPWTAENLATIRRLALMIKLLADGGLRFKDAEWQIPEGDK